MSFMFDKEIYCKNAGDMVKEAHQTIYESLGKLKYVNLKYKVQGQSESAWLYNVDFGIKDNQCEIVFQNSDTPSISVALSTLEYLKLRPYYIATCVGFKNIIFYSHEEKGVEQ